MTFRDLVPPILRGEQCTDLGPEARHQLEEIALASGQAHDVAWLRDECAARLKQPGASEAVEYLLAAACRVNGEAERAHQTLLALGEKLAAAGRWEPLAAVADRALEIEHSQAAVRLMVRAHEGIGREPARIEALQRAFGAIPDDLDLGLLLAVRLGEAGRSEDRRVLLSELLPRFAIEGRTAGLEEVALEFAEHRDIEGAVRLLQTLESITGEHAERECRQLVDIAFPIVSAPGRAGDCLASLRRVAARAAERLGPAAAEWFREPLVEAIRQGPARELPDPEQVIKLARLLETGRPILPCLERFDSIAALPPGATVHHTSFGAGRITSDDGETVTMDFAGSSGHRMPYAAARRTLAPIADDDPRLLKPADLARFAAEQPAELVWRVLRALGGAADAQRLKVFMVGSGLVTSAAWTTFWRKAKAAVEKDPRVDSSRAFEQHYRVAEAGPLEADAPLPALELRKPPRANLATLRKFLSQHPASEPALAQRFGRYIARVALDENANPADCARAGLYLTRWLPERAPEWMSLLRRLWERGLAISDLSGEDEQLALLEASHASGVEADAILSGLDSRFGAVRARTQELKAHLDEAGQGELRLTLLRHAPRYPGAALRQIEDDLDREMSPDERWALFRSALALIEQGPKPSTAEKVLRWIEPGGLFDALLDGTPCPGNVRLSIRVLLRQWRSSDRYLFPAVDAAERLGLDEEAEAVRQARQRSTDRLFANVGRVAEDADLPVMTRATWQRLKDELDRLERELRTTIPRAIQKARELGDLRENAEYHSAKLKQNNVSKLVRSLQLRLTRARFVEDADWKDGVVGLGTEVVLESDDQDVVRYWILGEEEHHHGEHVVSFQAPVGRALVGRAIGDEVELGEGEGRRRYHVVSVERRLPPAEEVAP